MAALLVIFLINFLTVIWLAVWLPNQRYPGEPLVWTFWRLSMRPGVWFKWLARTNREGFLAYEAMLDAEEEKRGYNV
jgi:hypothetical protein